MSKKRQHEESGIHEKVICEEGNSQKKQERVLGLISIPLVDRLVERYVLAIIRTIYFGHAACQ